MRHLPSLPILLLMVFAVPGAAQGQIIFDWPIRAVPQPEAVLTGASALLWNPGGMAKEVEAGRNVWVTHVDGPDATGVRGLAVAATLDLPLKLRGGVGYWHLGIPDIPRTTASPLQGPGTVEVAEDVLLLGLAGGLAPSVGMGANLRLQRGSAAGETRTEVAGDVGLSASPHLPFSPRFGVAVRGLGETTSLLAGAEAGLPPLAKGRLPIRMGYGFHYLRTRGEVDQRFSLRASWMGQFHAGAGLTRWDGGEDWTPLWMLGLDLGRYSFSVLRESLANDFGAVHLYRASVRLPERNTP